jgi:hypothetical protein
VAGWAFQWLAQLSFAADSWTAPQDHVRVGAGDDATRQAARQIAAHAARLRADGETRIPLYVLDAGYDEAPLTWDLREHLEKVQILIRLRNDRVLYRDPPPRIPHKAGRPRIHGSGSDRFECKNPATWGQPDQELSLRDERYGQVSVMSWSGLHPKLFCRGRFAGFAKPPVIRCHLIRVTVTRLPNGRAVPGPLWLWWNGPGSPDLDGSPSTPWAGTTPRCATLGRWPAGPGSSSPPSPSCAWPAPSPKTTACPGNGAASPAGSPPAASAAILIA